MFSLQVFVLMQFDPGLEYKPQTRPNAQNTGGAVGINTGNIVSSTRQNNNQTKVGQVGGGGSNKDDNSWLLLCSALTDGESFKIDGWIFEIYILLFIYLCII